MTRLPGQPMQPAGQQDPQSSREGLEAVNTDNKEGSFDVPKRHVAFHEPSLDIQESRVGRSSRPSQSPTRIPTRGDLHRGKSRVGRRGLIPSPDESRVQRPVAPISSVAESRIGRSQPPSPPREQPAWRRDGHRFPGVGESRLGHHHGRRRRGTNPPERFSSGAGTNYYDTNDGTNSGHPTTDEGFLFNIAQSGDPPSSAGATCATTSQASSDNNDPQRTMGLTPSMFNRDRDQRGYEDATPYLRPLSTEE